MSATLTAPTPAVANPTVVRKATVVICKCPTCGRTDRRRVFERYSSSGSALQPLSTCTGSFKKPHKPCLMVAKGREAVS